MKIELSTVLTILSIASILGGFILWVISNALSDKKDKLTLSFEIDRLKEIVGGLEEKTDKIDLIQNQLDVIKEQIKHL